jgi:hypothetical protein
MNVEEFATEELINRVREELFKALTNIGVKEGFRKDRLMTELTRMVCLSFV